MKRNEKESLQIDFSIVHRQMAPYPVHNFQQDCTAFCTCIYKKLKHREIVRFVQYFPIHTCKQATAREKTLQLMNIRFLVNAN